MLWNLSQIRMACEIVQVMERHGEGTAATAGELRQRCLIDPDEETRELVNHLSAHLRRQGTFTHEPRTFPRIAGQRNRAAA